MKNILLDQGVQSGQIVDDVIRNFRSHGVNIVGTYYRHYKKDNSHLASISVHQFSQTQLRTGAGLDVPSSVRDEIPFQVLKHAVSRISSGDVLAREGHLTGLDVRDYLFEIINRVHDVFSFLTVDGVVSYVTPHLDVNWAIAMYCDYLNIPQFWARPSTIFPGRSVTYKGQNPPKLLTNRLFVKPAGGELEEVQKILSERTRDYLSYSPIYMEKHLKELSSSLTANYRDLKRVARSPSKLGPVVRKRKLARIVDRLGSERLDHGDGPVVTFFLSFQPERTTVPEAGLLASQYLVASIVTDVLSGLDGRLLVREHPAQLTEPTVKGFRSDKFYRRLRDLPGVRFVPTRWSSANLIDKSDLVVSAGGSVLIEALARQTRAAYFSSLSLPDIEGLGNFSDHGSFAGLLETLPTPINSSLMQEDLAALLTETFPMEGEDGFSYDALRNIALHLSSESVV